MSAPKPPGLWDEKDMATRPTHLPLPTGIERQSLLCRLRKALDAAENYANAGEPAGKPWDAEQWWRANQSLDFQWQHVLKGRN